jgi:hypothetical protein
VTSTIEIKVFAWDDEFRSQMMRALGCSKNQTRRQTCARFGTAAISHAGKATATSRDSRTVTTDTSTHSHLRHNRSSPTAAGMHRPVQPALFVSGSLVVETSTALLPP